MTTTCLIIWHPHGNKLVEEMSKVVVAEASEAGGHWCCWCGEKLIDRDVSSGGWDGSISCQDLSSRAHATDEIDLKAR